MSPAGNFVISWMGAVTAGNSYVDIFAQRYLANGMASGDEFQVNTSTLGFQRFPSVAMDADGDFVIVWESDTYQNNEDWNIFGQRYEADGTPVGGEFIVNTSTAEIQQRPVIGMDAAGNFAVVFHSDSLNPTNYDIFCRRYLANGTALGLEFQVNPTSNTVSSTFPTMDMNPDGDFVVAWQRTDSTGSGLSILAQRFQANGVTIGDEFRVNTFVDSDHYSTGADLAIHDNGDFTITWNEEGNDEEFFGVAAQCYRSDGTKIGTELRVNTTGLDLQISPSIAMDLAGNFTVVWESHISSSDIDVFGQRFESKFTIDCSPDPLTLSGAANGSSQYHTQLDIHSTQVIEAGASVAYKAGTSISLDPGFQFSVGGTLSLEIGTCQTN